MRKTLFTLIACSVFFMLAYMGIGSLQTFENATVLVDQNGESVIFKGTVRRNMFLGEYIIVGQDGAKTYVSREKVKGMTWFKSQQ